MKNTARITVHDGKPSPRIVSSTRHLVRRGDRLIEEVLHSHFLRRRREALALLLLPFDPGLPGILHPDSAPRAVERLPERGRVVEVRSHDFRAAPGRARS